jgi:hypothetical protein
MENEMTGTYATRKVRMVYTAGLANAAPVLYFPGALIYSDVNQNFKKKLFLNNNMFQFFS